MENKIQELTDKIYREGVEKGNEEAQRLIVNAQEEAKKIIEDAHKEAESIITSSRKSADELAENTKSELKLFAGQAVNALKSEIATIVTDKIVTARLLECIYCSFSFPMECRRTYCDFDSRCRIAEEILCCQC